MRNPKGKRTPKAKVVVADSSISAPQMMDFWRKVGDGTIDGPIFQGFLANPRRFARAGKAGMITLARAINILGDRKVVGVGQAATVWKAGEFNPDAPIRYSEATLRQAAESNKLGTTDYRLIYVHGYSLREQRTKVGVDTSQQPCHYKDNTWWLKPDEDRWANEKPQPGYYLLDFGPQSQGRFGKTSWDNQQAEIEKLGSDCERAHETVVSEAAFSVFGTTGERLLEGWYHWGRSLDSNGLRVYAGSFDRGGWRVLRCHPSFDAGDYLRVVVSRKFQS